MTQLFKKPKAPAVPDYAGLAQQQGAENRESAEQTAKLGSPNEVTPWGSIDRQFNPDTNQFTYTTSLTPDQERLFQGQEDIDLARMDLGKTQIGNLSELWSQPFDTSGLPGRVSSVNQQPLQGSIAGQDVQRSVSGSPYQFNAEGAMTDYRSSIPGTDVRRDVTGSAYQMDPGAAPGYKQALDLSGLGSRPELDFGNLPALPGVGDFGAERQRVEDALYGEHTSRLDPEYQNRERDLRNQLYAQGVREGHPAWTQAFDDFHRERQQSYDTARRSAITGGGAEQSRMFGMASTARNQAAQEALSSAGFQLDSRSQGVAEALASGNFENAVVQLERSYGLDRQAAMNMATQLQNSFDLTSAQHYNTSGQQQFEQGAVQANLQNTVAQLERDYGLDRQTATNLATQMQNQFNLQQGAFANQASQQQFGQGLTQGTFANTAAGQDFEQQLANAMLTNQSRGQQFDEEAFKRSLPFNEFAAMTGGMGVAPPQFGGPTVAPGVTGAPIYQAGQDAYTAQYNNYAQQMAALNNLWSGISNIGASVGGGLAGRA